MDKICPQCAADPTSHSFKKISDKNGVATYYSHPAEMKQYKDLDGILKHVDNVLALNNKRWICIINGDNFRLKHIQQTDVGMGIIDLITNKYGDSLVELRIINPSIYIKGVVACMGPFLTDSIRAKIKVMDDRMYSVLEFI
jgi:hypothetical protein